MNLVKVVLRGELAEKFIPEVTLNIRTVRDAVDILCANFPKFKNYLMTAHESGLGFNVKVGDNWELKDAEETFFPVPVDNEIIISPAVIGSGRTGSIILGVGLLGLGISGVGLLGLSAFQVGLLGGTLLLQGLFGNQTEAPDEEEDQRSFIFSGTVNSASVGSRIPILYGYHRIGSIVISSDVVSYQTAPGG